MENRAVAIMAYDDAELLDIACVSTTLMTANRLGRLRRPYAVTLVSPGGSPIDCGPGVVLQSGDALERITGPFDTLVVTGGIGHTEAAADPRLLAHVRRLATVSRRVASVCTGATVLAAAGLLDGRRATTHWRFARQLAMRYPAVEVDADPIYIRDGKISTAAGVTSALDLTLSFVEEDHGGELARKVARALVTYLQRPGNQAQMSVFTSAPPPDDEIVRRIVEHVHADPAVDSSTITLAEMAGVSTRHLTRLFLAELGVPPARFVGNARMAAAAQLLVTTSLPLRSIAIRCGVGSEETLRRSFVRRYGIPPSRYRAVHRAEGSDRTAASSSLVHAPSGDT